MKIKPGILICLLASLLTACHDDEFDLSPATHNANRTEAYSAEVVTQWVDLLLILTREAPGFTPPVAARAFGYTGLALYESVRPGMSGYRSMAGQVNGLTEEMLPLAEDKEYHWGAVANATLATIIRNCYNNASAQNLNSIDELEDRFVNEIFKVNVSQEILERSVAFGKNMGEAIVDYALSDGQELCYENNFPTSFIPAIGVGLWEPTPPAFQRALQPYWGNVRPFLTQNVNGTLPPPPPAFSTKNSSPFWQETLEVYNTIQTLNPEQQIIADFWSDDPGKTATPPGHSMAILNQILERENANLAFAAQAFAKMGMGLHDAFISCWNAKYTYNLIRPITVIHQHIDPDFDIPLNTPPFPEYPSGHSVQSGAAAQILTELFGNQYTFTDHTHETRSDIDGKPRSYSSFEDFAEEAAISRLYGGIHYRSAIELGVIQGKQVGSNIGKLVFRY